MADGTGYGTFEPQSKSNSTYGYTYPEWYTGNMDSPSRIAQQLMKFGLKGQRLELRNRSLPLVAQLNDSRQPSNSFTILDQPRFVGFGTVESLNNREARLSCSFNEAIDQTNVSRVDGYLTNIYIETQINSTTSNSRLKQQQSAHSGSSSKAHTTARKLLTTRCCRHSTALVANVERLKLNRQKILGTSSITGRPLQRSL